MHTQLDAACPHVAEVGIFIVLTAHTRGAHEVYQVERVTLVYVKRRTDAIVEQSQFQTDVQLIHLFPRQVSVFQVQDIEFVFAVVEIMTVHNATFINRVGIDGLFIHLGRETVTGT